MSSEKQRTAWEKQMLVREKNRPTIHDYLPRILRSSLNCTVTEVMGMMVQFWAVSPD